MAETLKIAIPMAGHGTRLRPHTWSKPKPLLSLAGKTTLDFVLDQFKSVPPEFDVEYVFILGGMGEQIKAYMTEKHPDKKVHYVVQQVMRGQSDALYLAREHLHGKMLMAFSDTLLETDLSFLRDDPSDGVALVQPVPDPRRFGVASLDASGRVTRYVEKPSDTSNNLAVVGFYYFRKAEELMRAIEEQVRRDTALKGEYYLTDALNIMLEWGAVMRVEQVSTWLDAGTIQAVLETNAFLLQKNGNDGKGAFLDGVKIIPPVYIHPTASIKSSVIGPNVVVDAHCKLEDVIVRNSIIEEYSHLSRMLLTDSLIGRRTTLAGSCSSLAIGDDSSVR